MFLTPVVEIWGWLKKNNPGSPFKKRHLSFITIHYIYLTALTLVGSIMLYPAGGMAYIDALFFASGSATQSGLNTIDVSLLNTYQQVVLYMIPMIANPIFINTFVVFVRLYWFEKRFQHIVREARTFRRTRSRSRTNTQALDEKDSGRVERGVNGRSIVVLHGGGKSLGPASGTPFKERENFGHVIQRSSSSSDEQKESSAYSNTEDKVSPLEQSMLRPNPLTRDIKFADETDAVPKLSPFEAPMPPQLSAEQHIAFLENQRHPKDKQALRIPGPREFDRGDVPETMHEDGDDRRLSHESTNSDRGKDEEGVAPDQVDGVKNHSFKRHVTIDNSNAVHERSAKSSPPYGKLTLRKTASGRDKCTTASGGAPRSGSRVSLPIRTSFSRDKEPIPYLSWQPTIGRNSAFVDLTEEQREELGGIEYRSLKTLAILLVSYFFFFHILGVITFTPWIVRTDTWGSVVDNDGQSRVWWGIFTPASLFNDLGFTLTPDSFISFQMAVLPLFLGSILIIIGNTGFPCMLRFIIWICNKLVPTDSGLWEELKFLLDHPRRCFTLLFPSEATWWLFWILFLLNGIDLLFFVILDLNDPTITAINPAGYRVLDGLFQAASTRTAGTAVVDIANLHPAIQVSYLIMMYISAFPIAISVRRTNVYEEKSLGIYGSKFDENEDDKEPSYVGAHVRRQLGFDLWFIFLGLFIVAIAEGPRLADPNDESFSLFACLFEIVSAYGTVGLSLGYPNVNASFSTELGIVSKLVIIGMQIRGRHRGLPYELDRAILLPSESLHKKEDQDASKRMQRRMSNISQLQADSAGMGMFPRQTTGSVGHLSTTWEKPTENGTESLSEKRGQQEKVKRMSSNDKQKGRSSSEEEKSSSREEGADDDAADEVQRVEAALEKGESKHSGRFFPRGELGKMMAGLANGKEALDAMRSKSRED